MSNYKELLKSPKWQKLRLEIFKRDKWKCVKCSDTEKTLQVHHLKYTGKPWEAPKKDLVTLCSDCHLLFSKIDIDFNSVSKIVKFNKTYQNSNATGLVVSKTNGTNFYHITDNDIELVVGFVKNSSVLKTLFKLNNGK